MKSSETKEKRWEEYGCLFATFGALSAIPPGRDFMLSYIDPNMSTLVSLILALAGVGCFIAYFIKK